MQLTLVTGSGLESGWRATYSAAPLSSIWLSVGDLNLEKSLRPLCRPRGLSAEPFVIAEGALAIVFVRRLCVVPSVVLGIA